MTRPSVVESHGQLWSIAVEFAWYGNVLTNPLSSFCRIPVPRMRTRYTTFWNGFISHTNTLFSGDSQISYCKNTGTFTCFSHFSRFSKWPNSLTKIIFLINFFWNLLFWRFKYNVFCRIAQNHPQTCKLEKSPHLKFLYFLLRGTVRDLWISTKSLPWWGNIGSGSWIPQWSF